MKKQTSKIKHQKSAGAFTLVECLIALAISAVLLAAVAVAFNASVVNYGENEDMFWAINNARQAMARMTTQLRVAGYQHPTLGLLSVPYSTGSSNQCSFWTPDGQSLRYEFRSAEQKLYLVKQITSTTTQDYVLCEDVVAATFTKTPAADPNDAKSVQISLTVQSGQTRRTLSAAAVIRRNLDL